MTTYKVFRRRLPAGEETWEIVGDYAAHDAKGAIAAAATELVTDSEASLDGEAFAATPAASWKSEVVRVKVETRVRVG